MEGCYTNVGVWPKDGSLKVFKQWFDVQHYEIAEDSGRGPIENDEGAGRKAGQGVKYSFIALGVPLIATSVFFALSSAPAKTHFPSW